MTTGVAASAMMGTVHAEGVGKSRALPGGRPTGSASRRLAGRPRSPGPMVSPLRAYRHRASNQRLTVDGPAAGRQLARAVGHHGHSRHDNRAVQAEQTKGRTGMLARPLAGAARPLEVYRPDADDKQLEGDRGLGLVALAV
jgi:hypothetical protein